MLINNKLPQSTVFIFNLLHFYRHIRGTGIRCKAYPLTKWKSSQGIQDVPKRCFPHYSFHSLGWTLPTGDRFHAMPVDVITCKHYRQQKMRGYEKERSTHKMYNLGACQDNTETSQTPT